MTIRLHLPAYGKTLLNERRLGNHPLVIHLIYDEDWRGSEVCDFGCVGREHPRLCVKPSEFLPWTVDWHVVTGCRVAVFDRREDVRDGGARFYGLLGELGRFAAHVDVYRPAAEPAGDVVAGRSQFCFCAHSVAQELVRTEEAWPGWWPIETEKLNAHRRARWCELSPAASSDRVRAAA